jgi:DNA-directed RNA polymerase specialized sigma24 family protein
MSVQSCPDDMLGLGTLDSYNPSLDEFLRCHEQTIYSLALNLTSSTADAEEILAQVCVSFWNGRQSQYSDYAIQLQIIRETLAATTTLLEARAYSTLRVAIERTDKCLDEEKTEERLTRSIISNLHKLPYEYRKVFVLRDVLRLCMGDICEVLAISQEDYRVRLTRARLMLLRSLRRDHVQLQAIEQIKASEQAGEKPQLLV